MPCKSKTKSGPRLRNYNCAVRESYSFPRDKLTILRIVLVVVVRSHHLTFLMQELLREPRVNRLVPLLNRQISHSSISALESPQTSNITARLAEIARVE